MLTHLRAFASDLALIPYMWRHLVHYGRQARETESRLPEMREKRRQREARAEIVRRGYWDPAWGPTPAGAKELVRGSSF